MSDDINTEKPLSFDYFHQNEKMDTETVRSFLREYNEVGGLTILYFQQQNPDMGMDKVFLEKMDKKWVRPIEIKAVFEYLQEVIENQKQGIPILDELNMTIEKGYFKDTIKHDPKIGDLVKVEHANLMFEIVNIVDSDANFWGNKLTWKLTGKSWIESHEDEEITDDVTEPGWAPDEVDRENFLPNKQVDESAEDLHTYTEGDNPFGNN